MDNDGGARVPSALRLVSTGALVNEVCALKFFLRSTVVPSLRSAVSCLYLRAGAARGGRGHARVRRADYDSSFACLYPLKEPILLLMRGSAGSASFSEWIPEYFIRNTPYVALASY
ncbi:hypothetical protein EVAR_36899_1 [Eumeta japonica]|uniref:Uncharacterized protein n=1 Tax=Eumeta variegata TaxID=151549 RepID=A0A4C1WR93_EUMVA|nr:hypothetical protein EVAR_36899_1 [Eumeta japonica]